MLDALLSLTEPNIPPIALIGGLAVNLRLAVGNDAHRATSDIDVVTGDDRPGVIDVLGEAPDPERTQTVSVGGFEVDVIPTLPVERDALDGLDVGTRLFVVGHRWAFETATHLRFGIREAHGSEVELPVATPAGLVAAKSHAVGHPRAVRRATKHGGDLYDVFRLMEVFDADGSLGREVAGAPHALGAMIATVLTDEILANPARAMHQMSIASLSGLTVDQVTDAVEPFVTAISS
ncbi:MAG: nucleotidyl transferase AbiEii/AbiGii toxin family protein [Acidimicrobiia bacterium]